MGGPSLILRANIYNKTIMAVIDTMIIVITGLIFLSLVIVKIRFEQSRPTSFLGDGKE